MTVYMTIAKLTDSGLGVFLIIGGVIVATIYVLTSGLDSKDRLDFLKYLAGNPVLAWSGWLFMAVAIAVARWLLNKQRDFYERELQRVDEVKERALQPNLDLPDSKPEKK